MSKIKKSDLLNMIQEQNDVIAKLIRQVNCHHEDIIRLEGVVEPEPQLKQLDQDDDIAKELLEVNLSSELTGSELCKAMLERGDKHVMCECWCSSYADIEQVVDIVSGFAFELGKKAFAGARHNWDYATPINNQGEPLTAAEAGF